MELRSRERLASFLQARRYLAALLKDMFSPMKVRKFLSEKCRKPFSLGAERDQRYPLTYWYFTAGKVQSPMKTLDRTEVAWRMCRRTAVFLALAIGIAAFCGCGDDQSDGPRAYLTVRNISSSWGVTGVRIVRAVDGGGWGTNKLSTDIEPGESETIDFEPDTVNIRIESDHPDAPLDINAFDARENTEIVVEVGSARIQWGYY